MKMLHFQIRNEWYKVDEKGNMTQEENNEFSGQWKFFGVSFHHWKRCPDIFFKDVFENPSKIIGGLLWDYDHGTIRQWGGVFCGRLPRIQSAYVE